MSLFPAYSGSSKQEDTPNDTRLKVFDATATVPSEVGQTALDWLRSESFSTNLFDRNRQVAVVISSSESESSGVEVIDLDSEPEAPPPKIAKTDVHKKSVPLGANFFEDLSAAAWRPGEAKPTAYRIDRSSNHSLGKYKSIFEGHLSKYAAFSPQFALGKMADKIVQYRVKEQLLVSKKGGKRDRAVKRYFDRSQMKKLQKLQDSSTGQIKKSPLSVSALPEVLRLKPETTQSEQPRDTGQPVENMDLPYDELKKASIRLKIEDFNKRLNNEPKNIQLWLDFVNFQNDVAKHGEASSQAVSESALLEKKLAILDRALAAIPGCVQLLVEKIKLKGASAGNQDAVAEEWRNIAFVHPNNADVWWECLIAHSRRFSAFSVDRMLITFAKCLSTMSSIADGTIRSHRPSPQMEEQMIYIFMALVYILREAGFTERAVALLQCQIEFALFAPNHVHALPRSKAVDELEVYFSTSLPLFGQRGAETWAKWDPKQPRNNVQVAVNTEMEDEIDHLVIERAPEGSTRAQLWSFLEESRCARRVLPLPSDAPPTDDPERQVLFDDVSRFLVRIGSPENRYRLILLFLEFFGVDVTTICGSLDTFLKSDAAFATSFSIRPAVSALFKGCRFAKPKLVQYDENAFHNVVSEAFSQAVRTLTEPFRTHLICVYVKHEISCCLTDPPSGQDRVKRMKTQLREILREPANRNNLAVWALCSECEVRFGTRAQEAAVRMAETAISVSHQLKLYTSWGALCHLATQTGYFTFSFTSVDLTQTRACFDISRILEANVDDSPKIRHVMTLLASCLLRRSVASTESDNLDNLKAEVYESVSPILRIADITSDPSKPEPQLMPIQPFVCQVAECYGLFTYLYHRSSNDPTKNTSALTHADAVFTSLLNQADKVASSKTSLSPFTTVRRFLEQVQLRLHGSRIVMAAFDYRTSIKSVTFLKEIILVALNDFPSNPAFLRCLIALREPAFLSSSFVKFTRSNSHRIGHPLAWIAILHAMLAKIDSQSATSGSISGAENLVRQMFERALAVQNHLCNRSSILWGLYVAYEVELAGSSRRKLESVLYRALQACPWSKEIYMAMARNQVNDEKANRRLHDAVDMIIEKGLRLHTLVDELDTFPGVSSAKTT